MAKSIDPVSSIIARDLAVARFYRHDFEIALEQCDHTIELSLHLWPILLDSRRHPGAPARVR